MRLLPGVSWSAARERGREGGREGGRERERRERERRGETKIFSEAHRSEFWTGEGGPPARSEGFRRTAKGPWPDLSAHRKEGHSQIGWS